MKAMINGQMVDLTFDRATGRYHHTFTADETTKAISIISNCAGDTILKDIQLETGSLATPYVTPEVQTGIISGIFQNLKQINLEMTDKENSDLWANIKISTQGTLEKYHKDKISTEIARTAEGIYSVVNGDGEGSVNSRITQVKDLIEQRVSKEGLSGIIRNSGDNIMLAIADKGEGLKAAINLDRSTVRIKGETIHLDGAVFTESFTAEVAKIIKLSADSITTGELDASKARIINLDANTIVGLDANFIKAKIETALVNWLQGKVITATNNAMRIDLDQAKIAFNQNALIEFNSANNALVRRKGYYTAFLHFNDVSDGSLYAGLGVTSTGDGINSQSSGRFAGIRIFRSSYRNGADHGALTDEVQIYGDVVKIRHAFNESTGWTFPVANGLSGKEINMGTVVQAVRALCAMLVHSKNTNFTVNGDWLNMWAGEEEHISRGTRLI